LKLWEYLTLLMFISSSSSHTIPEDGDWTVWCSVGRDLTYDEAWTQKFKVTYPIAAAKTERKM
jgi:hypothetical protein